VIPSEGWRKEKRMLLRGPDGQAQTAELIVSAGKPIISMWVLRHRVLRPGRASGFVLVEATGAERRALAAAGFLDELLPDTPRLRLVDAVQAGFPSTR
jgi:hypothetical protein